jgi:hypothetical protein
VTNAQSAPRRKTRSSRWPTLTALTSAGLTVTGVGFLGASVDPGPGPRTVQGAATLGFFYLPPLVMAMVAFAMAALVAASRVRSRAAAGAVFAVIMLLGSATLAPTPCPTG